MRKMFVLSLCLFLLICLAGCEKGRKLKTEYVEGIVTLDGEILSNTTITFNPVGGTGEAASGYTGEKGVYTLTSVNGDDKKGALEGEYKITLSKVKVTEFKEGDPKVPKDHRGIPYYVQQKELIPKIYTKINSTPLTYSVVKGKQKHDIELKSK